MRLIIGGRIPVRTAARRIMASRYQFNRMEVAGSLGDLGTLLPLGIGMILINGISPLGVFFSIGVFYIVSGVYFGVTVPVQPMKVIGAYAVAMGLSQDRIMASGLLMGIVLLIIGITGLIDLIGKYVPKAVVRGVQLSTGTLLMAEGVKFIVGTSKYQVGKGMAEPYLAFQNLGPVPICIIIGIIAGILTLLLLENKRFPAGLIIILGGICTGLIFGTREGLDQIRVGLNLPRLLPFGMPSGADFGFALFTLVFPQLPMTAGNAVFAYTDLSREYFGDESKRVTHRATCISMALANFLSFVMGGMPLCHGAGGLAAHYRFGARTAGSNTVIGLIFLVLAVFLGDRSLSVVNLLPMSVLGVLLLFAGSQLALTVIDIQERRELFVILLMLGITLASSLAVGFIAGIAVAYALKSEKLSV